jgi:serine/threonine protein kinase
VLHFLLRVLKWWVVALRLIRGLVCVDPRLRLTVHQALEHDWMRPYTDSTNASDACANANASDAAVVESGVSPLKTKTVALSASLKRRGSCGSDGVGGGGGNEGDGEVDVEGVDEMGDEGGEEGVGGRRKSLRVLSKSGRRKRARAG